MTEPEEVYRVGDRVCKVDGDYTFDGIVVAAFQKLSGQWRYVAEDDRGLLFIFSSKNLKHDLRRHAKSVFDRNPVPVGEI
jgi:hypothetical protein